MGPILRGREWRDLRHLAAGVWPRVIGRFVGCPESISKLSAELAGDAGQWDDRWNKNGTDKSVCEQGLINAKKPALLSGLFF